MVKPANLTKVFLVITTSVATAFSLPSGEYGKRENKALEVLKEYHGAITTAARFFGVSPRLIASVIYAEWKLNYNWEDAILDAVFARGGYNSSVGVAQIKVNTARWIEMVANDPESPYYLGKRTQHLFPISTTRRELVGKLTVPRINVNYAAAYVAIICERWKMSEKSTPGVLATLYSLGLFSTDGAERLPHPNPEMNEFGRSASEFYESTKLKDLLDE